MTKKCLLALLLAAVMLLSGCSLVLKDTAVDNQQTIIEVNGVHVNKATFLSSYNYTLEMQQYMQQLMAQFGGAAEEIDTAALMEETVNSFISSIVMQQKATELGMDQFTEAELAEIAAEAQTEYDSLLEEVRTYYFGSSDLSEEELAAQVEKYALDMGYSLESMTESVKTSKANDKLYASVTDGITVDDAALQAALDEKIALEQENYAASLAAYGTAANAGTFTYYTPAGYRTVKMIEIAKPVAETEGETVDTTAAKTQADELNTRLVNGEAIDALGAEVATSVICESSTDLDEAIVAASMQLTKENTSAVAETEDSFVVLQYVDEVAEKTLTLDEARDAITPEVLEAAKSEAYSTALTGWINESTVTLHLDRIDN